MREPKFILDKPKSDKPAYIFLLVTCCDGRLKYSTKEKVLPTDWLGQRTIKKSNANIVINRISHRISELQLEQKTLGKSIGKNDLKKELDLLLGRNTVIAKRNDFFTCINAIINAREIGLELTKEGKRFSKETIKGYRHTRDNLYKYEAATKPITFDTIDINFYHGIISYFNRNNNISINGLSKIIKNIKVFLQVSYKKGWHNSLVFKHEDFKIPSETTVDIYLTEQELMSIASLELKDGYELARDWFLVECFTGLRVSDALRLKKENIEGNKITISNEKTDERVVIPVHKLLRVVLSRWNGWPPSISEQKINKYIKEIGRMADLTEKVLYTITKGGKRVDEYLEKWQMISNHTGRRSFITNLLRQGVSETITMKLTGIRKNTTLNKYNKMSSEEIADIAAELPFFK